MKKIGHEFEDKYGGYKGGFQERKRKGEREGKKEVRKGLFLLKLRRPVMSSQFIVLNNSRLSCCLLAGWEAQNSRGQRYTKEATGRRPRVSNAPTVVQLSC